MSKGRRRAKVTVLIGPAGAGKTTRALERYRDALQNGPPGVGLWLAPNTSSAVDVQDRLLEQGLSVCFRPNVLTFAGLAERLLCHSASPVGDSTAEAPGLWRPATDIMKRSLLRELLRGLHQEQELPHFAPIVDTQGFLEMVADFLGELKRAEIWPDELQAALQRRKLRPKDREVLLIYRRYQDLLVEHQLYDREGRLWLARDLLGQGDRGPFQSVWLVVVDGFSDFSRTQYDMLGALSQTADEVLITLPDSDIQDRGELFATSKATLAALERLLGAQVEHLKLAGQGALPEGLAMLERHLFRSPSRRELIPAAEGIEIIEAPAHEGEVRMLAYSVKRDLRSGVPADQVAVVFRDLDQYAPLVEEVFGEQGIPFAMDVEVPLAKSAVVKAFLALLKLPDDEWRYRRLMSALRNGYFQPRWSEWQGAESIRDVQNVLVRMGIPAGLAGYLEVLERWASAEVPLERGGLLAAASDFDWHESARRVLALLRRLGECLNRLPERAAPPQWVAAIKEVAGQLGFPPAQAQGPACGNGDERGWSLVDAAAWASLDQALDQWLRAQELLGRDDHTLSRREFLEVFTQLLHWQRLRFQPEQAGRVRVLEAAAIRNLSFEHVYVAGLGETAFPRWRRDDLFYSESERQVLSKAGLRLGHPNTWLQEEMLLFYNVVTRARRKLVLSYPVVDEKGEPILASPFLQEVRRLFAEDAIPVHRRERLDPVPAADEVEGPADLRIRAVSEAAESPNLLAALAGDPSRRPLADNILAALSVAHYRFGRRQFGPFDGLLEQKEIRRELQDRFGPEHVFSAGQLESYTACPFRFFAEHVLGLEPVEEPSDEFDPRMRGLVVHRVLARMHRQMHEAVGREAPPPQEEDRLRAWIEELRQRIASSTGAWADQWKQHFEEFLADEMRGLAGGPKNLPPIWELEYRRIGQWGSQYLQQHERYEKDADHYHCFPCPTYVEVPFGMPEGHPGKADAAGFAVPAPLVLGSGPDAVRVCGRIDRLDVGHHDGRFLFAVIDYKTGGSLPAPKHVKAGQALQLPIYALAVERLIFSGQSAIGLMAGYWAPDGTGFKKALTMAAWEGGRLAEHPDWKEVRSLVEQRILDLVREIRGGRFPVASRDESCSHYCPFQTVCRIQQIRPLDKTVPGTE